MTILKNVEVTLTFMVSVTDDEIHSQPPATDPFWIERQTFNEQLLKVLIAHPEQLERWAKYEVSLELRHTDIPGEKAGNLEERVADLLPWLDEQDQAIWKKWMDDPLTDFWVAVEPALNSFHAHLERVKVQ